MRRVNALRAELDFDLSPNRHAGRCQQIRAHAKDKNASYVGPLLGADAQPPKRIHQSERLFLQMSRIRTNALVMDELYGNLNGHGQESARAVVIIKRNCREGVIVLKT